MEEQKTLSTPGTPGAALLRRYFVLPPFQKTLPIPGTPGAAPAPQPAFDSLEAAIANIRAAGFGDDADTLLRAGAIINALEPCAKKWVATVAGVLACMDLRRGVKSCRGHRAHSRKQTNKVRRKMRDLTVILAVAIIFSSLDLSRLAFGQTAQPATQCDSDLTACRAALTNAQSTITASKIDPILGILNKIPWTAKMSTGAKTAIGVVIDLLIIGAASYATVATQPNRGELMNSVFLLLQNRLVRGVLAIVFTVGTQFFTTGHVDITQLAPLISGLAAYALSGHAGSKGQSDE